MHRHTTAILVSLAGSFAGAGLVRAAELHVPGEYVLIEAAIADASDGDVIIVAPGTYFEHDLDLDNKAITITSSGGPDVTTVNALGLGHVFFTTSGEGPDTVIERLTITGGDATGRAPDDRGGGLYIDVSSPTVVDCIFTDNVAIFGGGVYCNSGSPSFTDCEFRLNTADLGGGAYSYNSTIDIVGGTFEQNDAVVGQGGGFRAHLGTYTITGTTFSDNTATNWGGALDLAADVTVTIDRCKFLDNFAGDGGAEGRGGAIAGRGTTIRNSIFVGNHAHIDGGALQSTAVTQPMTVHNCTFSSNTADAGNAVLGGSVATSVVSCIIWGNGADPVNPSAAVSYSNIEASDPLFVDEAARDLDLQPGSPAIDAGNTEVLTGTNPVDLDGRLRAVDDHDTPDTGFTFLNLAVDMGAYELQPDPQADPCPVDLDDSGEVDFGDILEILANWGFVCP